MKIRRTIPPTAAPVKVADLLHGLSGFFKGGKYLEELERQIKEYFGVKHVFLTSSGKASLTIILRALSSLSGRREVLIPAYTCYSVPSAIIKAGLKVALCDIEPSTMDYDYKKLKDAVTDNTLCVVSNHLFCNPSSTESVMDICKEHDAIAIEDAAQAMGGNYNNKKLGTIGDVGFFSLGRGKNITCGSGGIVVTNDDAIAEAIEKEYSTLQFPGTMEEIIEFAKILVMSFFINPLLFWFPAALPFLRLGETIFYKDFPTYRLSGMKAGLMHNWVERLEETKDIRSNNASYFSDNLGLKENRDASIPYLRYPVITKSKAQRDAVIAESMKKGLGVSTMYPTGINDIDEIKEQFIGESYPGAENLAERLLTLPTHSYLKESDKEEICGLYKSVAVELPGDNQLRKRVEMV